MLNNHIRVLSKRLINFDKYAHLLLKFRVVDTASLFITAFYSFIYSRSRAHVVIRLKSKKIKGLKKKNKARKRLKITKAKTKASLLKIRKATSLKSMLRSLRGVKPTKKSNKPLGFRKKEKTIKKIIAKKRKFIVITQFTTKKRTIRPKLNTFRWVNRISKLWSSNKNSYNSYMLAVKAHSGFKSLRNLYSKGLKRYLKSVKKVFRRKSKLRSVISNYSSSEVIKLKLRRANNYCKYSSSSRKFEKIVRRKNRRRSIRRSRLKRIQRRSKSFKRMVFRSRRLRNALFKKKLYSAIKNSKKLFRKVLGIKSKGKNRLVKNVKSLDHKTFYAKLLRFEMSLISLLLKTTFVRSFNDALFLIHSGYVYVNGSAETNHLVPISSESRIQLPVTKLVYVWLRKKNKLFVSGYRKANRLRWYKRRVRSSRFKRRSYKYPKWLFKYSMLGTPLPICFEVDYTLMCAVVLYRPYKVNELTSVFWYFINLNSHSVYLWKTLN